MVDGVGAFLSQKFPLICGVVEPYQTGDESAICQVIGHPEFGTSNLTFPRYNAAGIVVGDESEALLVTGGKTNMSRHVLLRSGTF